MRHILIDTDTGSDDAVALLAALREPTVKVEAITTVCGNIPLSLATKNALISISMANTYQPPVFVGAEAPLFRPLFTAENVHGEDGLGDVGFPEPEQTVSEGFAPDKIIEYAKKFPNELELIVLGPATNIAIAIQKDPEAMSLVKHIYSMGTGGFGWGNVTPVAEFNVFVDAEAYDIMLKSGIPLTIIGFDVCLGTATFNKSDMDELLASSDGAARFAIKCNSALVQYNIKRSGEEIIDMPDPVAMAVALWPEVALETVDCNCIVCTIEPAAYGQVILDIGSFPGHNTLFGKSEPNAGVVKTIDSDLFKNKIKAILTVQA